MKASIKKRLKKTFAFVSALSIIGSFSQAIGAFNALSYNIISAAATDDSTGNIKNDTQYSMIDIEISNQLDFSKDVECTVSVFRVNSDGTESDVFVNRPLQIGGAKDSSNTTSTGYIDNGTYIVEVHAPGFQQFRQEITNFNNMVCTLKVTLGFQHGYAYTDVYKVDENGKVVLNSDGDPVIEQAKGKHPGVLNIGDVNGDGDVTIRDEKLLLEAIDYSIRNNYPEVIDIKLEDGETLTSDLNRDGKTNLADLTFFTRGYVDTRDWDTTATVTTVLSEKYKVNSIKALKPAEGTEIKGDIKDLFKSSSTSEGEQAEPKKVELGPAPKPVLGDDGKPLTDEEGNVITEVHDISDAHPLATDMDFDEGTIMKEMTLNATAEVGTFDVETASGEILTIPFANKETTDITGFASESSVSATFDENGNIVLDLGNQIAVKKITITITKAKNTKLVEIGEVEFLNGMEKRIPEPKIDYPTNLKVEQDLSKDNKSATIKATWDKSLENVDYYEFEVSTSSATKQDGSFSSVIPGIQSNRAKDPEFILASEHGNFKLIKANTTYYVHVRTVTDEYKSSWSDYVKVTTVSTGNPDKPDYVSATGGYKSVKVTWGSDNTNSTTGYKLYYKNVTKNSAYNEINVGKTTSYQLTDLDDLNEYEVYVIGYNGHGDSPQSVHSLAMTTTSEPVQMNKYNVINCDDEGNVGSAHIVSVTRNGGDIVGNEKDFLNTEKRKKAQEAKYNSNAEKNQALENNPLTAWAAVDGDANSYYVKKSWDDGGYNWIGNNGLYVEFDDEYEIGSFAVSRPYDGTNYSYTQIIYWDADENQYSISRFQGASWKTDVNNKGYCVINLPKKIKAKKMQIAFGNATASGQIAISEMYFYAYDYTMEEIMNLYVDDFHTVLRDNVTQETIDELREKINLKDPRTGDSNPNKAALERELQTAEKILNAEQISKPVLIHNGITNKDPIESGTSRQYTGLNAWQPLGVSIGVNTEITIYVGSPTKKTGESTDLRIIATQYNSESKGVQINAANLVVGANTFQLTAGNMAGAEAGGALYIQYQGNSDSNVQYSVRITGGSEIPMLDLYQVTDREERLSKAADYIEALDKHVANMEAEHNKVHKGATYKGNRNTKLDYDYEKTTCILGATDILCDTMMYSLPAPQILAGLGKGTTEERAEILIRSMDSMEDMMKLFYQHKGMSADANQVVNRIPNQHLNIRYQRMFSGAAMYAAGNHIGIQWGSAPAMVNSKSVTSDENGKYVSGSYFGWGIAHEIGHCINDSSYEVAEITNNYYALLAQSQDKNEGSRLNYKNIYKKVTSNMPGNADQGTQLGMYWQLHLAYDKDYNFKTYDTNSDILNNLFYARMDTYSRNPSRAPKPHDIALTLSGGTDQQIMRLACAAAEKNVLEFFERWGKTPDETTISYASQFPKETRAIMYANEDSRVYAMTGESSLLKDNKVIDNVKVNVGTGLEANKVSLSISVSDKIKEKDILGYEIIRCTISSGDVKEIPIGFATSPNFTDTISSLNNRTVSYKVILIDQYLNRSEVFATEMVKIHHDGSLDKTYWNISTSNLAAKEIIHEATEELPCSRTIIDPATDAIDDKLDTIYTPNVTNKEAEIILNFNEPLVVTGMKYTAGNKENSIGEYKIYVKNDKSNDGTDEWKEWIEVADGTFNGSNIVYFSNEDNKYISTYDTTAVKLQILNQNDKSISIAELDVLGVTGDNVDFRKAGETAEVAFGILSADYKYGTKKEDYIPEGSLVFTGSYKGNPAYNAVILFDENGDIVGSTGVDDKGKAQQIILADVPDGSVITEVSIGTWVYWINPENITNMVWPKEVRVELYRVNNALSSEGQRIVSDSLFETVAAKDKMPSITLDGNRKYTTESTVETTTETTVENTTKNTIETTTEVTTEDGDTE